MTVKRFQWTNVASGGQFPSWRPSVANSVNTLTTGQVNGIAGPGLTNTFASTMPSWFSGFYGRKIVTDDSGGCLNVHYGPYGALHFEGGGHATTNNNCVVLAELLLNGVTFRCVQTGSNYWPTQFENDQKSDRTGYANVWAEYPTTPSPAVGPGGLPAARHSYGDSTIIGPANGGAIYGTHYRLLANSLGQQGWGLAGDGTVGHVPHKMDFTAVGGAPAQYVRAGSLGSWVSSTGPPVWSALAGSRNAIYSVMHNPTFLAQEYFDLATGTFQQSSFNQPVVGYDNVPPFNNPQGGVMFDIPERNLLVWMGTFGGVVKIQILDVSVGATSPWSAQFTPSPSVPAVPGWVTGCWCSDLGKILIGMPGTNGGMTEITVPATLTNPWVSEYVPFASGSVPWPIGATYKQFAYNPKIGGIAFLPIAVSSGTDTLYVIRPRGL